MDLSDTPAEARLRRELRAWLRTHCPRSDGRSVEYGEPERLPAAKAWQRKLYDAGFVAAGWPRDYGGRGADPAMETLIHEELVRAGAPGLIGLLGVEMVGPTLIQWGTDEQKRQHLPLIPTAERIWCQGYSEPGSGSDLASLRTRGELRGDEIVVNGQKVWTSYAQFADWMFCLVRTDPDAPKHAGISYVLIDMRTPGITVRPLVQMTGDAGFNEVFLEDVRVPRANVVGPLHQGWQVANSTLRHERNMLGSSARTQQMMAGLLRLARRNGAADAATRDRIAALAARVEALRLHALRELTDDLRGRAPGIAASVTKLVGTELNHDIATLACELLGTRGLARDGLWPFEVMFTLGMIIGGGTSQIQKNIIAERGLGLPRG